MLLHITLRRSRRALCLQCLKLPCRIPSSMLRYPWIHGWKPRGMMVDLPGEQNAAPSVADTQQIERIIPPLPLKLCSSQVLNPSYSHLSKIDKDPVLVCCGYFNPQLTSSLVKLLSNYTLTLFSNLFWFM